MAVRASVPYEKTFSVSSDVSRTYAFLSDVEKAVPLTFPGVERIENKGGGVFRWEFEKVGYSGYEVAIVLVTQFSFQPETSIKAQSVPTPDTAQFEGSWKLSPGPGGGCEVLFRALFEIDLPIPFFVKAVALPLAQKEMTKLFDRYVARVEKNLA